MKLTAQKKLKILNQVLKDRKSVTSVCAEAGVARKTFYQWKKRYQQAPNRIKKQALKPNYASGKRHPKNKRHQFKDQLISIVVHHPSWGSRKISAILCKAGYEISNHAVHNLLKDLNLETKEKREEFGSLYQTFAKIEKIYLRKPLRLTPEARKRIIEEVVIGDKPVSQVCRKYRLSRKTFYKWLKRYQEARLKEAVLLQAMEDSYVEGFAHPRSISEKTQEKVLVIIRQHPEYSTHKVAQMLAEVGNHGVQNVFQRLNLNTYEKRLAYTEAYQPVTTAPKWVEGIKTIFGRIPVISAIPPPKAKAFRRAGPPFIFSFLSSIVFSTIFIYWLRMLSQAPTMGAGLGLFFASVSLLVGSFFFAYSMKYYLTLAIVLSFSRQAGEEGVGVGLTGEIKRNDNGWLARIFGIRNGSTSPEASRDKINGGVRTGGLQPSLEHIKLKRYPFVSIHLPFYNEKKVAERILKACIAMDYPSTRSAVRLSSPSKSRSGQVPQANYEIVVIDDSTDETTKIVKRFAKKHNKANPHGPKIKVLHRPSREGFKGGALGYALKHINPKTEFVVVFDADFIPYPDTLELFVKYFKANNPSTSSGQADSENYKKSNIAVVGGYQWHVLNKSENWITRGVRTEYAGSYVIERPGREILGLLKQISGSVYMIRADVLKKVGWGTSITEDFQLTLKLYEQGYKVIYTPYIQAPAECASTLKRLIRQRMRWAEGHSNNIRKMFFRLMSSPKLTLKEKLEVLYISPYYLQAFFFLVGTFSWLLAEIVFRARLPFWTSLWGWSLVLTNFFSLPLVNTVGLFLEESEEKDYLGILSFVALSYIMVPFQAYASIKGFIEKEEGPWFRTPKTGRITDIFTRGRFYRWISGILPGRQLTPAIARSIPSSYLALVTANNQFNQFKIPRRRVRWVGRLAMVIFLIFSMNIVYFAPLIPLEPGPAQAPSGSIIKGNLKDLPRQRSFLNLIASPAYAAEELPEGKEVPSAQNFTGVFQKISEFFKILTSKITALFFPQTQGIPDEETEEPTINILNERSHPKEGEDWTVNFKTTGRADLTITLQDQATIDDLEFVSLRCGDEEREPKIFDGPPGDSAGKDIIFYLQWECNGEESLTHHVNKTNKHTLKFQFGDKIAYAYNSVQVDTSTSSSATAYSFQRKTWHDGSRLWSSSYSGSTIEFWYSENWGSSWTQNTKASVSAITYDAKSSNSSASTSSLSWSHTIGSGPNRILIVGVSTYSQTVSSVTYDGTGLTSIGSIANGSGGRAEIFKLLEASLPSTGSYTIEVTLGGSAAVVAGATSWSGIDQTTPHGTFTSNTGASNTPTVDVSSAGGEMVVDTLAVYPAGGGIMGSGAGQTQRWSATPSLSAGGGGSSEPGETTVTMSWSTSVGMNWAIGAISLKPDTTVTLSDFSIEADFSNAFIAYTNGYDVQALKASSYPGTSFYWGDAKVVYDGSSSTDEYDYPAITKDSNNKVWITARHYNTGTVDEQVGNNADDGFWREGDSTLDTAWGNIYVGYDSDNDYNQHNSFMRFTNATVPNGATIDTAYFTVTPRYSTSSTTVNTIIDAVDADNASAPTTYSEAENATRTTATVTWNNVPAETADSPYNSLSIVSVIKELVDRSGWTSGNAMVIYWEDNGSTQASNIYRRPWSHDGSSSKAPQLHIEWSNHKFQARQASGANDVGTWQTATTLDQSGNSNKYGTIVPLNSGDMYAAWIDGTAIEGCFYDEQTSNQWEDSAGTACSSSKDSIDTGVSGLSKNMSAVADTTNYDVHLLYIEDDTPDTVSYARWDNGSGTNGAWQTEVTLDSSDNDAYVTFSINTATANKDDLYAIWIDTNNSDIYYRKCDDSAASSECSVVGDWASEVSWQTTGTNAWVTSNYSGDGMIFAQWTEGTGSPYSVMWDYPLIPFVWDGSSSTNWFTGANWNYESVPGDTDDVVIDGNYSSAPTINAADTIGSLKIGENNSSTLTFSNNTTLTVGGNVNVYANATITHTANTTAETHKLTITASGDMTIDNSGTINVGAKGYNQATGPGAGTQYCSAYGPGAAASYGGWGGCNSSNGTYGSITAPNNIGSGGKNGYVGEAGRKGGGAIKLDVTGTLTINGTISAEGQDSAGGGNCGGGGSGGSIWIIAGSLAGTLGSITVNGGSSGGGSCGGGGGGRIAITGYTSDNFSGTKSAYGGNQPSTRDGGAGTIYTKSSSQTNGDVLVDNNNLGGPNRDTLTSSSYTFDALTVQKTGRVRTSTSTTLTVTTLTVQTSGIFTSRSTTTATTLTGDSTGSVVTLSGDSLTISNTTLSNPVVTNNGTFTANGASFNLQTTLIQNGTVNFPGDDLTIGSGGTLEIKNTSLTLDNLTIQSGGVLDHTDNSTTEAYKIFLTINQDMDINSTGKVNVNEIGYNDEYGTGHSSQLCSSYGPGSGASYGGWGGCNTTNGPYGSEDAPVNIGSGGQQGYVGSTGGDGAGAVRIDVTGTLTISGEITANGQDVAVGGNAGGGGSGGSVYLNVGTLGGCGTISADGGDSGGGGGGGGGRIAYYYTTDNFSSCGTVTAAGGTGKPGGEGDPGTIIPENLWLFLVLAPFLPKILRKRLILAKS